MGQINILREVCSFHLWLKFFLQSQHKREHILFTLVRFLKLTLVLRNTADNIAVSVCNMKVLKSERHLQTPLLKTW